MTKKIKAAIVQNATKRKNIPFHSWACVYTATNNVWISSTSTKCVTERLHEYSDAPQLYIKYVYGQVRVTVARRVHRDCDLPEADDAEVTVFTPVHDDVKPYQPTTFEE